MSTSKLCSKCKKAKPLGEFNKHKGKSDGLQTYCKECQRFYNRYENRSASIRH